MLFLTEENDFSGTEKVSSPHAAIREKKSVPRLTCVVLLYGPMYDSRRGCSVRKKISFEEVKKLSGGIL